MNCRDVNTIIRERARRLRRRHRLGLWHRRWRRRRRTPIATVPSLATLLLDDGVAILDDRPRNLLHRHHVRPDGPLTLRGGHRLAELARKPGVDVCGLVVEVLDRVDVRVVHELHELGIRSGCAVERRHREGDRDRVDEKTMSSGGCRHRRFSLGSRLRRTGCRLSRSLRRLWRRGRLGRYANVLDDRSIGTRSPCRGSSLRSK